MRHVAIACGIGILVGACSSGDATNAPSGGGGHATASAGRGGHATSPAGGASAGGGGAGGGATSSGGAGGLTASGGASAGGSGGAGGSPSDPLPGNAVVLGDGRVVPLLPVTAKDLGTRAIGFTQVGTTGTAHDEHGAPLWAKDLGEASLSGGFDFDADGVPDLALIRTKDTGVACGATTIHATSIDVAAGRTGDAFPLEAPLDAICWHFGDTVYPTDQWTGLGVIFGEGTSALATQPYYAEQGTFRQFDGKGFTTVGTYAYPSTPAFDAAYPGAKPNAYGQGHAYVEHAHVANGLLLPFGGETRLAFFTSARFAEIAVGPLAADQLRVDAPFLTGGRVDLAGRDYGRVARDPGAPGTIVLVSGTSADTLASDMATGTMAADPWGQIERHVTRVDLATGAVDDRFFSYAHDGGDAMKYEGRVVTPEGVFVRRGPAEPSRLAFDVYEGGHWQVHVTVPGGTADALVLKDQFLWDVRDLDGDGTDEWVLSPSRDPGDPDVPGYYFCKWRTTIAHFDDAALALVDAVTVDGAIPKLVPSPRRPDVTSSRGALYPALTARGADGTLALLLVDAGGALVPHPL